MPRGLRSGRVLLVVAAAVSVSSGLACGSSRGSGKTPVTTRPTSTPTPSEPKKPFRLTGTKELAQLCKKEKALWNPGHLSCSCHKPGHLFEVGGGCQKLTLSPEAQKCTPNSKSDTLRQCLSSPYSSLGSSPINFSIDTEEFTEEQLRQLASQLYSETLIEPLKGMIILAPGDTTRFFYEASRFGSLPYRQSPVNPIYFKGKVVDVILSATTERADLGSPSWLEKCNRSLGVSAPSQICTSVSEAQRFSQGIHFETPRGYSFTGEREVTRGTDCLPFCAKLYQFESDLAGSKISYQIDLREFVPFRRQWIYSDSSQEVTFSLNGVGELAGVKLQQFKTVRDGKNLLSQTTTFFDPVAMEPVHTSEAYFGPMDQVKTGIDGLKELKSKPIVLDLMPTERPEGLRGGTIRAMMLDSGIDPFSPGIRSRLRFSLDTGSEGDLYEFLHQPIPMRTLKNLFFSPEHGTEVASVMLKDLPNATLHVIVGQPNWGEMQLSERIEALAPKVVNISQNFAYDFVNCQARFRELFQRNPQTLFVVGAGNTGTENPDTCPANAIKEGGLQNVVSVAGTENGRRIHRESSWGKEVATLAAPYSNPCLQRRGRPETGKVSYGVGHCSGTSISAAWVSNWALKEYLRLEENLPLATDIVSSLKKKCQQDFSGVHQVQWQCAIRLEEEQ